MFAFCPMVSHANCGIMDSHSSESSDMNLIATDVVKNVSTTSMKYREGRPEYRSYDACYY